MKTRFVLCVLVAGCTVLAAVGSANAGFIGTYVDATPTNTTPSTAFVAGGGDDYDNLWANRIDCGELSTVFESNGHGTEDCPALTTTVSGLANGSYQVYAVYWGNTDPNADWPIQAAISGNSLVTYSQATGPGIATGTVSGTLAEYEAPLGIVDVSNGSFSVTVDDGGSGSQRTRYDGVSYHEVATPEPGTCVILITAAFSLLAYAWRKRK